MKNILKLSLLVTIFAIVALSSCKKETDDTVVPDPPYFTFAKVGNVSTYETSAVVPLIGTKTGTMSQTIIEKSGTNIYKVITTMDLGLSALGVPATTDTAYWFISETEMADVDDAAGTNKFMYYAKGDAVNKTYTMTDLTSGVTTRTILSTSESVSTGAGVFSTYKIKETSAGSSDETNYFVSNTAGMVKTSVKVSTTYSGMPITITIDITLKSKNF